MIVQTTAFVYAGSVPVSETELFCEMRCILYALFRGVRNIHASLTFRVGKEGIYPGERRRVFTGEKGENGFEFSPFSPHRFFPLGVKT